MKGIFSPTIDRPAALRMVSQWAARFIAENGGIGSIEKGKKADLLVLGADYLTVPEDEIETIPVLATMGDGKVVYGNLIGDWISHIPAVEQLIIGAINGNQLLIDSV